MLLVLLVARASVDLCLLPGHERCDAWQRIYGNASGVHARANFYANDKYVCAAGATTLQHNKFSTLSIIKDARVPPRPVQRVDALLPPPERVGSVNWPIGSIDHMHHVDIEDQLSCQSCWAFTTTTVVEAALAQGGTPHELSPQHLINCAINLHGSYTNLGCDGGYVGLTMDWGMENGFVSEAVEPYSASEEPCETHPVAAHVGNAEMFPSYVGSSSVATGLTQSLLEAMVTRGPTEVVMHAGTNFTFHGSEDVLLGVDCDKHGPINHAVVVVGFGIDANNVKYWNVANSWGSDWNNDGFIKIERGVDACGMETHEAVRPYNVTLSGHSDSEILLPHDHTHDNKPHTYLYDDGYYHPVAGLFVFSAFGLFIVAVLIPPPRKW